MLKTEGVVAGPRVSVGRRTGVAELCEVALEAVRLRVGVFGTLGCCGLVGNGASFPRMGAGRSVVGVAVDGSAPVTANADPDSDFDTDTEPAEPSPINRANISNFSALLEPTNPPLSSVPPRTPSPSRRTAFKSGRSVNDDAEVLVEALLWIEVCDTVDLLDV